MKDDLISRKPLIDVLQGIEDNLSAEATREDNPHKAFIAGVVQEFKNLALAIPGVGAVPVVHARWVPNHGSYGTPHCSRCKWRIPYSEDSTLDAISFCPNCGAKMDAKEG